MKYAKVQIFSRLEEAEEKKFALAWRHLCGAFSAFAGFFAKFTCTKLLVPRNGTNIRDDKQNIEKRGNLMYNIVM